MLNDYFYTHYQQNYNTCSVQTILVLLKSHISNLTIETTKPIPTKYFLVIHTIKEFQKKEEMIFTKHKFNY